VTLHIIVRATGNFHIFSSRFMPCIDWPNDCRLFKAADPSPPNGAIHADKRASLSWSPADSAASHDVYFGDNFDEVNNAAGGLPAPFQSPRRFTRVKTLRIGHKSNISSLFRRTLSPG